MQQYAIQPTIGRTTVYAGEYALLDSDVYKGGGTNQTDVLQAILDKALDWGSLHLIMDGAALVDGLKVYANTTIECVNPACGFFLDNNCNEALLRNAHLDFDNIQDRNITLIGGTYNHNFQNQAHHLNEEDWVMCIQFYGVENLILRGITVRNQSSFGIHVANWKHVLMQDIVIDIPHVAFLRNQDGIHFWGPGRFLTMRNICGTAGDDFIALAPDERDGVSDITDVLIDGVQLDDADQGIRMLSKSRGRLDRITVRNVSGTYKSFGFFLNPWFYGTEREGGSYGNILIENVDLRQTWRKYRHYDPFLFLIGGNYECLTLRNIAYHRANDDRQVIVIDHPYHETPPDSKAAAYVCNIQSFVLDGFSVFEDEQSSMPSFYITVNGDVQNMWVQNVRMIRTHHRMGGRLLSIGEKGRIQNLYTTALSLGNVESGIQEKIAGDEETTHSEEGKAIW